MEEIKVSFNQLGYEKAMDYYKTYKEAVQNLNLEAQKLGVTLKLNELEEAQNPFTLIATKHFETLGVDLPSINPVKYLSMTDIDTSGLSVASNKYLEVKKFKKMPTKADFTTTLKGTQAEEWRKWEEISEQLNKWFKEGLIDNPLAVARAMRSRIKMGNDMRFSPVLLTR